MIPLNPQNQISSLNVKVMSILPCMCIRHCRIKTLLLCVGVAWSNLIENGLKTTPQIYPLIKSTLKTSVMRTNTSTKTNVLSGRRNSYSLFTWFMYYFIFMYSLTFLKLHSFCHLLWLAQLCFKIHNKHIWTSMSRNQHSTVIWPNTWGVDTKTWTQYKYSIWCLFQSEPPSLIIMQLMTALVSVQSICEGTAARTSYIITQCVTALWATRCSFQRLCVRLRYITERPVLSSYSLPVCVA